MRERIRYVRAWLLKLFPRPVPLIGTNERVDYDRLVLVKAQAELARSVTAYHAERARVEAEELEAANADC